MAVDSGKTERLAESIKTSCPLIKSGSPSVFKLPLEEEDIGIDGCKSYTFGQNSQRSRPNRTVMFLGETGSGKSTLINGMINYILGIEWKDSFRFKLIDEGQLKSQAESQTSHVTAYKVNHQNGFRVPYSLTIIDTPGFGNTSGIERDRAITEQIRRLFTSVKGVSEIDAVCFVTQAFPARLTATQEYILDSVMSVFGKDVAENIWILITFADGQPPPVLAAINDANIPCPKTDKGVPVHHKFNNSALFADNRSVGEPDEEFEMYVKFNSRIWRNGADSMERFFTVLEKITTRSEKRLLEVAVEGIQPQVQPQVEIRSTQHQRGKHKAEITSEAKPSKTFWKCSIS